MLTSLQMRVSKAAAARMRHFPWYRGVNVTGIMSDTDILEQGFSRAVNALIDETYYSDGNYAERTK
jgi:hypothetical protein